MTEEDIGQNSGGDDDTDDQALDTDGSADNSQAVFKHLPDAGAGKGAEQKAGPAQGRDTADNTGRHSVHFIGVAGFHVSHGGLGRQDKTDDVGAESADHIGFGSGHKDIDTGELGCIHIGSDGINVSAGPGLGHNEEGGEENDDGDPEGIVDAQGLAVVEEVLEGLARFFANTGSNGVRVSVVVDHVGDAAADKHGAQGGDEGRNLVFTNQNAVNNADDDAGQEGDEDGHDDADALGHQGTGDHSRHGDDGSDGQVNVSGNQDDGLTHADQEVLRHGPEKVHNVGPLKNIGINQSKDDHQNAPGHKGQQGTS